MNSIVAITIHTCGLAESHHSNVDTTVVKRIRRPPMVGVPALLKWLMPATSTSCRTIWPILKARKRPIIHRPSSSDRKKAVPAPMKARKVT